MNKIQSYQDLLLEKEDLEARLSIQRGLIRQDLLDLKRELKPATDLLSFVGKLTMKNRTNSLVNLGVDMVGDVLIKNFLLAKSGWITRLVLPYFIKNFSTNVIAEGGGGFLKQLVSKLTKK